MKIKKHLNILQVTFVMAGLLFLLKSCKKDPVVPVVSTAQVTELTASTARSGGTIVSNGGAEIIQMGVCWATTVQPTIDNFTTSDGITSGSSAYTSNITGLQPGIKYYVRAYARNSVGLAYGDELSFTTPTITATLTTSAITDVTIATAKSGGNITSDGGAAVTARGVCWSKSPNPTVSGDCTSDGQGTGSFTSNITGLDPGTKYYVRAYATNELGTGYGDERSFTTDQVLLPTVTTSQVSSVGVTTASAGGNVTSDGGGTILARGLCWNTSGEPDIRVDDFTTVGGTTGTFSSTMNSLSAGTVYYVRAYARNSAGTAYGNEVKFSTSAADIDGNVYPTVIIGSQLWMEKDLKTSRLNDGTSIPNVIDDTTWVHLDTPAYCWYDDDSSYGNTYGMIYNWYAVGTGKLCPVGWKVPSDNDFKVLEVYIGMPQASADSAGWRGTDEGTKLKNSTAWQGDFPNSNSSGWNALPGGYRYGKDGGYVGLGYNTYWWSSTEHWGIPIRALYRRLRSGYRDIYREGVNKAGGKMVRCLKGN